MARQLKNFTPEELKYIWENLETKSSKEIGEQLGKCSSLVSKKIYDFKKKKKEGKTIDVVLDYKSLYEELMKGFEKLGEDKDKLQDRVEKVNSSYVEALAEIDRLKETPPVAGQEITQSHEEIDELKQELFSKDKVISDMRIKAEEQGTVIDGLRSHTDANKIYIETISGQLKEAVELKKVYKKHLEEEQEENGKLMEVVMNQEKELDAYRLMNKVVGNMERVQHLEELNKVFISMPVRRQRADHGVQEVNGLKTLDNGRAYSDTK